MTYFADVTKRLPRTSPFFTSGACADGNHEGLHEFERRKGPWADDQTEDLCEVCGKRYRPGHLTNYNPLACSGRVSRGSSGDRDLCQCLCHPVNQRHGHWHMVNAGSSTSKRTICLGYDALNTERGAIVRMPPKAYLKKMEDEDDACYERRERLHREAARQP